MSRGEPVTYCRIFSVGPACQYPCAGCKAADRLLTDADRERLLAPRTALLADLRRKVEHPGDTR